jgi:hypothetical protein
MIADLSDRNSIKLLFNSLTSFFPTAGDISYALYRQWQRIDKRTRRAQDADGRPFTAYNRTRPYYYYPGAKRGSKADQASLRNRAHVAMGFKGDRTKTGIKFDSYAAFHEAMGAPDVDLRFPVIGMDHMMDDITLFGLGASSVRLRDQKPDFDDARPAPANMYLTFPVKGRLAAVHNAGEGRQPRREFFAFGNGDAEQVVEDIRLRMYKRVEEA